MKTKEMVFSSEEEKASVLSTYTKGLVLQLKAKSKELEQQSKELEELVMENVLEYEYEELEQEMDGSLNLLKDAMNFEHVLLMADVHSEEDQEDDLLDDEESTLLDDDDEEETSDEELEDEEE